MFATLRICRQCGGRLPGALLPRRLNPNVCDACADVDGADERGVTSGSASDGESLLAVGPEAGPSLPVRTVQRQAA